MNGNENHIIKDNIKHFRILNEYVNRYDIIDAIKNHEVVKIYYQGDETVNRGFRTIEPHVLGRTTAGNLAVRSWQQAGASDSKHTRPDNWTAKGAWRLFLLDGISQMLPTNKEFTYYPEKYQYNSNGDSQMTDILIQVDYGQEGGFHMFGFDSMDDPDLVTQRVSKFDPQTKKFKDFYDDEANKETIKKDTINALYDMTKKSYKKSPNDYIVVHNNGKYFVANKYNVSKFDSEDVLGNLVDVVREINGISQQNRIPSTFIDDERRDFKMNTQKRQRETNQLV